MSITARTVTPVTRRAGRSNPPWRWCGLAVLLSLALRAPYAHAQEAGLRADFRIKYVASGVVYLQGGRNVGLKEDLKLSVKRGRREGADSEAGAKEPAKVIGQVKVISVAEVSVVCEIVAETEEISPGDLAYLEPADAEALTQQSAMANVRKYPQVITFTEGDPLEEEARDSVPRPPLPEINRATGRLGIEYGGISSGAVNGSC